MSVLEYLGLQKNYIKITLFDLQDYNNRQNKLIITQKYYSLRQSAIE